MRLPTDSLSAFALGMRSLAVADVARLAVFRLHCCVKAKTRSAKSFGKALAVAAVDDVVG